MNKRSPVMVIFYCPNTKKAKTTLKKFQKKEIYSKINKYFTYFFYYLFDTQGIVINLGKGE